MRDQTAQDRPDSFHATPSTIPLATRELNGAVTRMYATPIAADPKLHTVTIAAQDYFDRRSGVPLYPPTRLGRSPQPRVPSSPSALGAPDPDGHLTLINLHELTLMPDPKSA